MSKPFWPLTAPGMPPPGPSFSNHAESICGTTDPAVTLADLYYQALYTPGFTLPVRLRAHSTKTVPFVIGHIWGQYLEEWNDTSCLTPRKVTGPQPAQVMVIGKIPGVEEVKGLRNLIGPAGEVLLAAIGRAHIEDADRWYVTNLCKFAPPDGSTRIKSDWLRDCLPLLAQELRIVRPEYILCLGADATKALLGKSMSISNTEGRVLDYSFCIDQVASESLVYHTAKVMTVLHPVEAARDPAKTRIVDRSINRFGLLIKGQSLQQAETDIDHRVVETYEDAVVLIQEIQDYFAKNKQLRYKMVAWDAEWEGQHPINPRSYLRTIQCSWAPKKAACFKIAHAGGKLAFKTKDGEPAVLKLATLLNAFMEDKLAVGHFFNADLEWLHYYGFNLEKEIPVQNTSKRAAFEALRKGKGYFDTALAVHAIEETAMLGLEILASRYTTCPRWDLQLLEWKKKYCAEKKLVGEALEGYGECPDDILFPYANYDADATLRIMLELIPLLDRDYEGNDAWEPFWANMITQPVILDIAKNGIAVDRDRVDMLTSRFVKARKDVETKLAEEALWPGFNVRSLQHVKEYLYGDALNGKFSVEGNPIRIRPEGAISLKVTPLLDTSKPPRRWDDLVTKGLDKEASPSTSKLSLDLLAQEYPDLAEKILRIQDHRFIDQVLKGLLRPPLTSEGSYVVNDEGNFEYEAGLVASLDCDGRVRTHLSPTAETGRWKSRRPNLQNISKSRDKDLNRLLSGGYTHKLRSILTASGWSRVPKIAKRAKRLAWINSVPGAIAFARTVKNSDDKKVLIEFDYKGAELFGMAIMSGDTTMIEHAQRSIYDDAGYDEHGNKKPGGKFPHPDYYDIHSNVAVATFRLNCLPTKTALEDAGYKHYRTLAKNVIFGIAYGRGAKAIALQARAERVDVSVDEAQQVIDSIFSIYPRLQPFFEMAQRRAIFSRWLSNCFGRYRRFPQAFDNKAQGEFARQAMNFPIQSMIADAVNRGLANLRYWIRKKGLTDQIKILMQIHDAGLVEVSPACVEEAKSLIKYAMCDCVPLYPTELDGTPMGTGPYFLSLDFSVETRWGEKMTEDAIKILETQYGYTPSGGSS